jgi:zona occludens toxin
MITLITGAPGAGKTAALVSLLAELSKGRAVYCSGIPDLQIDHQPLDDPSKWHETVPDGSIIVIDEVQNVWRPRGPGQGVPPDIQALEVHRHRGLDFYIITQAPRLVHTNVRALVGRHVHLRDVGFLGRYWYEWPECAENCSATWKSAPLRKKYKLPKAIFGKYKSASEHIKPLRSFPFMLVVAAVAVVATLGLGGYAFMLVNKQVSSHTTPIQPANSSIAPASALSSPSTSPPETNQDKAPAYDVTSFYPVLPQVPESAPAYDELRKVVNLPRVAGGVCGRSGCTCYTEQATRLPMTSDDCRRAIENPAYDPYREQVAPVAVKYEPPPSRPIINGPGVLPYASYPDAPQVATAPPASAAPGAPVSPTPAKAPPPPPRPRA